MSAARCAIKMRSTEADRSTGVKLLKRDLTNAPNHCFGHHNQCSPDFCSTARDRQQQTSQETPALAATLGSDTTEEDDDSDLVGKLISLDLHKYNN